MGAVVDLTQWRNLQAVPVPKQAGFIQMPNALEDALLRSPLTRRQERVYRAVLRKTLGYGKESDCIATSQLAEMTGLDEANVRRALSDLLDYGMLIRGRRTKYGHFLSPVMDETKWEYKQADLTRLHAQTGQNGTYKQAKSTPTKDNYKIQKEEPNGSLSSAKPKTRKKAEQVPCPHQSLIDLYHELLPTCTQVREWNEQRKKLMQSRWREKLADGKYADLESGLAYWTKFFRYVAKSDWLTGRCDPSPGRKQFVASLEWLIRPSNFAKVVEGNYHEENQQ